MGAVLIDLDKLCLVGHYTQAADAWAVATDNELSHTALLFHRRELSRFGSIQLAAIYENTMQGTREFPPEVAADYALCIEFVAAVTFDLPYDVTHPNYKPLRPREKLADYQPVEETKMAVSKPKRAAKTGKPLTDDVPAFAREIDVPVPTKKAPAKKTVANDGVKMRATAPKKAPAQSVPAEAVPSKKTRQPRAAGVTMPRPGTKAFKIWEIADALHKKNKLSTENLVAEVEKKGLEGSTAKTQLSLWRSFHGVAPVRKGARGKTVAPNAPAKKAPAAKKSPAKKPAKRK